MSDAENRIPYRVNYFGCCGDMCGELKGDEGYVYSFQSWNFRSKWFLCSNNSSFNMPQVKKEVTIILRQIVTNRICLKVTKGQEEFNVPLLRITWYVLFCCGTFHLEWCLPNRTSKSQHVFCWLFTILFEIFLLKVTDYSLSIREVLQ